MTNETQPKRMFFTFRNNGTANEQDLAEVTVENLEEHEPSVGANAEKKSWFGPVDTLSAVLPALGFTPLDLEGVLSTLRVNKVATRELSVVPDDLTNVGFRSL